MLIEHPDSFQVRFFCFADGQAAKYRSSFNIGQRSAKRSTGVQSKTLEFELSHCGLLIYCSPARHAPPSGPHGRPWWDSKPIMSTSAPPRCLPRALVEPEADRVLWLHVRMLLALKSARIPWSGHLPHSIGKFELCEALPKSLMSSPKRSKSLIGVPSPRYVSRLRSKERQD